MPQNLEGDVHGTRAERARQRAARLRNIVIATLGAVAVFVLLAGAWLWAVHGPDAHGGSAVGAASTGESVQSRQATVPPASVSEVPELVGLAPQTAVALLRSAGFVPLVTTDGTPTATSRRLITGQQPAARVLAAPGSPVTVIVPPELQARSSTAEAANRVEGRGFVVVLDPGHQSRTDSRAEALGPGSALYKPAMSAGGAGVVTRIPEYEITLELANNLRARLEAAGVKVVMTRTTNDVDLSNAARAAIATAAHADLFVRIHADTDPDPTVSGVSTMYPGSTGWTAGVFAPSKRAAVLIEKDAVMATGAVDKGSAERSDMVGFNWATVPSVQVQAGYLSNELEDRLLSSPNYQDKLGAGICEGVLAYLGATR